MTAMMAAMAVLDTDFMLGLAAPSVGQDEVMASDAEITIAKIGTFEHVRFVPLYLFPFACREEKTPAFPIVTVGQTLYQSRRQLQLKIAGRAGGLQRRISEGRSIVRGLALAGFYRSFAFQRIQDHRERRDPLSEIAAGGG